MNSHEVFIHIHQGCFAGTGAIVRLPQCQWSKPDGYGKISQCITTTKHSKAKTVCIFLGIYCIWVEFILRSPCNYLFIFHFYYVALLGFVKVLYWSILPISFTWETSKFYMAITWKMVSQCQQNFVSQGNLLCVLGVERHAIEKNTKCASEPHFAIWNRLSG